MLVDRIKFLRSSANRSKIDAFGMLSRNSWSNFLLYVKGGAVSPATSRMASLLDTSRSKAVVRNLALFDRVFVSCSVRTGLIYFDKSFLFAWNNEF